MTLTTRHSTLETKLTGLQGALQEAMTQLYTQQRTVTVWLAVLTVACIALALVVVLVR